MMRFAPGLGLLVASPVVIDALRGRRGVDEALLALLIAVAAAAAGMWVLSMATKPGPPAARDTDRPSGAEDAAGRATPAP